MLESVMCGSNSPGLRMEFDATSYGQVYQVFIARLMARESPV